jgi:hypothetical protein
MSAMACMFNADMFINSMEQSHPEKLIVAQLANKFHDFYKT